MLPENCLCIIRCDFTCLTLEITCIEDFKLNVQSYLLKTINITLLYSCFVNSQLSVNLGKKKCYF